MAGGTGVPHDPDGHSTSHLRICTLCEATCRVTVEIDDGVVTDVRGDKDAPFSRGHLCAKGRRLGEIERDPDRLHAPLKRVGDQWQELSWDDALDEVAQRIVALQRRHGDGALATYFGNPSVFDYATVFYSRFFLLGLRAAARFSASSLDGLPHQATSFLMFGHQLMLPVPDLDRTDLFVVIGANPAVSNGSIMTAPGIPRRLHDLRQRGGRLVVIDPRRSETALLADQHLAIRPGTDPVLLLGLLRVILHDLPARPMGRVDRESVGRLAELCDDFDLEAVGGVTGIPAGAISELGARLASARRAVCYGRIGAAHQRFSSLTCWLITVLNAVTGNLDRPGGAMFTRPAVDLVALSRITRQQGGFGRPTRVKKLPTFGGELPVAAMADEIEAPGPGQIRALVTLGGNLALSAPNGKRLDRLFADNLELMVAIDPYLNETTRHADYLLPPARPMQRDQYGLIPALVAVRNVAEYAPPAVPAEPGALEEWEILNRLHRRIAHHRGGRSAALHRPLAWFTGWLGPRRMLDVALRIGPYGIRRGLTRSRVAKHRHGLDLGPLVPMLARRRIRPNFVPGPLADEVDRLRAAMAGGAFPVETGRLILIGRRQRHASNSWLHNIAALAGDDCVLLMHPDDGAARGIADRDLVRIRSERGQIDARVALTTEMLTGVVSLPHGWGHGRAGSRLGLAGARPGASINDLTDERRYDAVTGTAQLSGIPVSVDRCERPEGANDGSSK